MLIIHDTKSYRWVRHNPVIEDYIVMKYVRSRDKLWVNRWIFNWFCFSSIKDCKCSVNGSVGCHSIGMCIYKGNYSGSQCPHCKLNSIFQIRLVLILSLLAFMPVVILRDAFKRIYFSQRCVFCCVTYYKNIHFPENIEWTTRNVGTRNWFVIHMSRTLNSHSARGIFVDYDDEVTISSKWFLDLMDTWF